MDKLKMHTPNKADENFEKLASLFPNAVTETIDKNGEVVRAIDKDVLMQEINSKVIDGKEERYQFTWPDKKKAVLNANSAISDTLRPCREESVDFDNTENLYIEGDNLDVLKLLQETYLGKVKMIYIDPPYNTGNDFVYNDNFSQNADDYMENSGQFDEVGNRMVQNTESNGRFHTDWLNMIYPRLKLARNLLTDDGAIFISIGDEELFNLKKIADEILGEKNFAANLIWQSTPGSNTGEDVKTVTENVLLYSKNKEICKFATQRINNSDKYVNRDEYFEKRGGYILNKLDRRMTGQHYSEALNYPLEMPDGSTLYPGNTVDKQEHWNWRWSESKVKWGIEKGFIVIKPSKDNWSVYFKQYENVNNEDIPIIRTLSYQNLISIDGANSARGTREVMNVFDGKYFDYPKPLNLISHFEKMLLCNNDTILDFFSGSATTAHAVMQLNAEDGGHRKFIMVQLPEKTDEKSEAFKAGYKNICEIGKERIRRAGKKIVDDNKDKDGIDKLDIGFRVLKLDSTNMKDVYYNPNDYNQILLDSLSDNIKEDRTPEDLLFQVMLDMGILLSSKIEEIEIGGKRVFNVADGFLFACFDENVSEDVIKAIATKYPESNMPTYFVMRDRSMANDSVATNFEQILKTYSPDTVRKVL